MVMDCPKKSYPGNIEDCMECYVGLKTLRQLLFLFTYNFFNGPSFHEDKFSGVYMS